MRAWLAVAVMGSAFGGGCLAPPGSTDCQRTTDCPADYFCDPARRVCTRATTDADAATGDGSGIDAAGPDCAPADVMRPDRASQDTATGDGVIVDAAVVDALIPDASSAERVRDGAVAERPFVDAVYDDGAQDRVLPDLRATDNAAPADGAADHSTSDHVGSDHSSSDQRTADQSAPDQSVGDALVVFDSSAGADAPVGSDACTYDCSGRCAPATSCGQTCPAQCGTNEACLPSGQCIHDECASGELSCDSCWSTGCETTELGSHCLCQDGFAWDAARRQCVFSNDGSLTVGAGDEHDLSSTPTPWFRSCGDGVVFSVVALTSDGAQLAETIPECCLAPLDQLLLINLQADTIRSAEVGAHEFVTVDRADRSDVRFLYSRTVCLGDEPCLSTVPVTTRGQQIALYRVPRYAKLAVEANGRLIAQGWNGSTGGVLALRAEGSIEVLGAITMTGLGYAGGWQHCDVMSGYGLQGESILGPGRSLHTGNLGGGGGGCFDAVWSCSLDGAGGGYGGAGQAPAVSACPAWSCLPPIGGEVVPDPRSGIAFPERIFLGSGGGGAGCRGDMLCTCTAGGAGGGAVFIEAKALTVKGELSANGTFFAGVTTSGGGGSGGSIVLRVGDAVLNDKLVQAIGGAHPNRDLGTGGDGRISLRCEGICTGSSMPEWP